MQLKKSLFVVFLIVATELIGFGLIIPVLPQLAIQFNLDHFLLGILMSSFSFAQFFAAPYLGYLSDKYGRKNILIISKLGTVFSYCILAFANNFWLFLFARLLDGFTGGNIAVVRAYITDITDNTNRSKGMAIIGMSFGLGFVLGPALGGILHNEVNGQMVTSFVAAFLSLIATLFTFFLLKEPENKNVSSHRRFGMFKDVFSIKNNVLYMLAFAYFVYMFIFSAFEVTFSVFTDLNFSLNAKQNSLLFMYLGVIATIIQGYFARKVYKSLHGVIFVGCFFICLGFAVFCFTYNVKHILIPLTLIAIGFSIVNTFLPSLYSFYIEESSKGVALGVYESIGSICRMIAPLVVYALSFNLIKTQYLCFSQIILITGFFIYFLVQRNKATNTIV